MAHRTPHHEVNIQFGDCDPAGIVFYPNFSRWMDAASLSFFMQCGVPPWRELVKTRGIVGTPLLEIHTRFSKAVTYGQAILITTWIEEWRARVFVQMHRVTRGVPFQPIGALLWSSVLGPLKCTPPAPPAPAHPTEATP